MSALQFIIISRHSLRPRNLQIKFVYKKLTIILGWHVKMIYQQYKQLKFMIIYTKCEGNPISAF